MHGLLKVLRQPSQLPWAMIRPQPVPKRNECRALVGIIVHIYCKVIEPKRRLTVGIRFILSHLLDFTRSLLPHFPASFRSTVPQ